MANSPSVKRIVKRSLQHIAAAFGPHRRTPKEPVLLVLMYHRILPENDTRAKLEEPGMMVTPETFRMHMQLVKQYFDVLPLSQWIDYKNNDKALPPRCCAITFDDGWADNYEFAYPVLKELRLPATIFLVSDMIGTNRLFWPERVAHTLATIANHCPDKWNDPCLAWLKFNNIGYNYGSTPPDKEQLSALIGQIKALTDEDIHSRLDNIAATLNLTIQTQPALLGWDQVIEMHQSGLIETGSHTCNHIRLTSGQNSDTLMHEVIDSHSTIEKNTGAPVTAFCYPNGDHCPEAVTLVRKNYACAVTTHKGWNTCHTNVHTMNRIAIHEDISADETAFLARISGWL